MAINVLSALKIVGKWVANNPTALVDVVDTAKKLLPKDKVGVLSAAVVELEQKTDENTALINTELETIRNQMRTMKRMLTIMGAVLGVAVIAIILLAIF